MRFFYHSTSLKLSEIESNICWIFFLKMSKLIPFSRLLLFFFKKTFFFQPYGSTFLFNQKSWPLPLHPSTDEVNIVISIFREKSNLFDMHRRERQQDYNIIKRNFYWQIIIFVDCFGKSVESHGTSQLVNTHLCTYA